MFPRKIILFFVQLFPILVDSLVIQIPSETVFGPQNPTQGQFQNAFGNVGFIQFIRIVCCTRNSSFPVVMKPYITYGCLEACFFSQIFLGWITATNQQFISGCFGFQVLPPSSSRVSGSGS